MRIDHIALWVQDLEKMRVFYETYFAATANNKYSNATKGFTSYFLHFDNGARLEIMHRADIAERLSATERLGYTHLSIAVGSDDSVNQLTETLRLANYEVVGEPRITGDGYYESVVLDPEGNRIELLATDKEH